VRDIFTDGREPGDICCCPPWAQRWRPENPERCSACGAKFPQRGMAARRAALDDGDMKESDLLAMEQEMLAQGEAAEDKRYACHPTHYCITCGSKDGPGAGCGNCRQTGFDQTPCLRCNAEERT
jgi:hypothetical protein